jgi:CubicO group peptidase (beta-lactamase class C family)
MAHHARRALTALTLLAVAAAPLAAQTTRPAPRRATSATAGRVVVDASARARIDSTLRALVGAGRIAGVEALVWEKGREAYYGAFGMADREAARPMARDAIVQIFSMTKPITGVALLTLVEEGKVRLDEPIATYLPEFAALHVWAGADSAGRPILERPRRAPTVRDLTRHTAGFATGGDNPGVGPLFAAADPMNPGNTLEEFGRRLARVPLLFHPGERWAYGVSVDVQALLVERVTGRPFAEYVRERILEPLKMRDTRYLVPAQDRARLAAMYTRADTGTLRRVPDASALAFNTRPQALTPGGWGLTSTIDDYMRFARMLLNEGSLDGARILKPETVRLMRTSHLDERVTDRSWLPSKGQVGFGIDVAVRLRPPASAKENAGEVGEFFWDGAATTLFWVDPTNRLAAVMLVQLMPFDRVGLHRGFRGAVYGGR